MSRLRAVLGAMAYCEKVDRELVLHWPKREARHFIHTKNLFEAAFSDLWSNPFTIGGNSNFSARKCASNLASRAPELRWRTCWMEDFQHYMDMPVSHYFDQLKASTEVYQRICDLGEKLTYPCVGVHLRHYGVTGRNCPSIEWFTQEMHKMPDHVRFLLVTDTVQARDQVYREFGGRTTSLDRSFRYDRDEIIKQAAELYMLRGCDWVIGSRESSYTELVALLRGAKKVGWLREPPSYQGGRCHDSAHPIIQEEYPW